jgi:GNAT superfamily N-acetyltransferase
VLIEARPGDDAGLTALLDAALKELFTRYPDSRQDQRGRGIARRLVLELEQYAVLRGAELLRLATGGRQPEAIALYESLGYQPAERYGKYVTDHLSRCYAKTLRPSPAK